MRPREALYIGNTNKKPSCHIATGHQPFRKATLPGFAGIVHAAIGRVKAIVVRRLGVGGTGFPPIPLADNPIG